MREFSYKFISKALYQNNAWKWSVKILFQYLKIISCIVIQTVTLRITQLSNLIF